MNISHSIKTLYRVTSFALPISMGSLINMLSSFIAMMMVAKIGKTELAAGALGVITFLTVLTSVSPILYALGILIGHHRGQGKSLEEIGNLVKSGFWLAILLAIPVVVILWNIDFILTLFKQDPTLIKLTTVYFRFAGLTMIPVMIGGVILQFYSGIGYPRITFILSIISLPLIVLASYGFVLGHFGLPQLGLGGITCASFIVQTLVCIAMLIYMYFRKSLKVYKIFSGNWLPNWSICKNIFSLGLPIGIQYGSEVAAMSVGTYFMGFFGVDALAASQIVSQYSLLFVMIALGLSQAVSILVSEAFGKNNIDLVNQYVKVTIIAWLIVMVFNLICFIDFPRTLLKFYMTASTIDNHFIKLTIIFFIVSAILLLIDGIRNILAGGLRGLHDSKIPMRVGILGLWLVSLPGCYLAGFIFNGGPVGLRFGFLSGFIFSGVILWWRWYNKTRELKLRGT